MKKQLICLVAAAAFTAAAPAAMAAENVNYIPGDANSVEVSNEAGKKTVLITDASANIVYINQATDGFTALETFKLKNGIADGQYTVKIGADSGVMDTKTFYIGMSSAAGDVELTKPATGATAVNGDSTVNIGYMASNVSGSYSKLIIKKADGNYYGMNIGTMITFPNGGAIGIQFNNVASESDIQGVWLSNRGTE